MKAKIFLSLVGIVTLCFAKEGAKMRFEKSVAEDFVAITTTSKTDTSSDDGKIIHDNFEILQKEFPKLGIKMNGPVTIIYRYNSDENGNKMSQYEIETAYPIQKDLKIAIPPGSKIQLRKFQVQKCAKYLFKGPVWETPWSDLIKEVKATGVKKVSETREVYKVFREPNIMGFPGFSNRSAHFPA